MGGEVSVRGEGESGTLISHSKQSTLMICVIQTIKMQNTVCPLLSLGEFFPLEMESRREAGLRAAPSSTQHLTSLPWPWGSPWLQRSADSIVNAGIELFLYMRHFPLRHRHYCLSPPPPGACARQGLVLHMCVFWYQRAPAHSRPSQTHGGTGHGKEGADSSCQGPPAS